MFYSHEILTQRQYGIATVWLVATLGLSRTALKKIGRKDILSVDVPKACDTVTNPEVPLALRLQSSLLVGISRVYSQQFEYLYHDVSNAHTSIRKLAIIKQAPNLDMSREARPEQIVLMDDPELFPEMLPMLDLADLGELSREEFDIDEVGADSMINPGTVTPSQCSQSSGGLLTLGTRAPSSTISAGGDHSIAFQTSSPIAHDVHEGFDHNPQFEFGEDGDMRDVTPELPPLLPEQPETPSAEPPSRFRKPRVAGNQLDSEDIEEQVRREHEEGQLEESEGIHPEQMELDNEDPQSLSEIANLELPVLAPVLEDQGADNEGEDQVAAAFRKPRGTQINYITIDADTVLSNLDLKAWHRDYLENMDIAWQEKHARRISREAKEKARIFVMEYGICGQLQNPVLKALFSGEALLNFILGNSNESTTTKRKRTQGSDNEESDDKDARKVRPRTQGEQDEIGRGSLLDGNIDMELGRDALPNVFGDAMQGVHETPHLWSAAPSEVPFSVGGVSPSSHGGYGSVTDGSPLRARNIRGNSRMSVASNLGNVQEEEEGTFGNDDSFLFPVPANGAPNGDESPKANKTQRSDIAWKENMEKESLAFLENNIKRKLSSQRMQREDHPEEEEDVNFITFESAIAWDGVKSKRARNAVALAFHHTVVLATKELITVSQEVPWGAIQISAI